MAAARLLGTCQDTTSPLATPRVSEPARDRGDEFLRLDGGEPGVTVDNLAARGRR